MGYYEHLGKYYQEHEPQNCVYKFKNITKSQYKFPIKTTLDSDLLPNGLSIFISSNEHPFFEKLVSTPGSYDYVQNNIFMMDMNSMLEPIRLKILNQHTNQQIDSDQFNLFALSVYQDRDGNFKIIAGSYITEKKRLEIGSNAIGFSFERFVYNGTLHSLIHLDSYKRGLDLEDLCDLVAIDDDLFYFTKCFSSPLLKELKLGLEVKNGEIWLFNSKDKVTYMAANNLFMPKSIAYLKSNNLIIVTNLAVDGITLYKREFDNSLSRLQNIKIDSFVFNINIDSSDVIWLTLHSKLYETLNLIKQDGSTLETQLIQLKLDLRHSQFVKYELKNVFSTNGSLLNALGSSLHFKENLVLFSILSDPKICKIY